jgi:uncharacterized protein (UPF0548 family)
MFLVRRPQRSAIDEFLLASDQLTLSYDQIGVARESEASFTHDEAVAVIGHGADAFARAKLALDQWRQFELGWVELFPKNAATATGTNVAVLIQHLGLWSLNGCRVVYHTGDREAGPVFGVAYGTLTSHAECGEELFEVALNPETLDVTYSIRAASRPRATLAQIGYPVTRLYQACFRRDSIAVMKRVGKS